ncbi:MAG: NADH-quinone oxidoreductase subunit M [Nitrospiraceae bacterium]|nr:NADH-quinone oxidoreductase subunit M [Nitrospiraceae bacterium]
MILLWLIIVPLIAGPAAWAFGRGANSLSRWISLLALAVDGVLVLSLWQTAPAPGSSWIAELRLAWIPQLGIGLHLAADGLSLVLVSLTIVLGLASVLCSWKEIGERVGFFHFNLLWILSGILGVFLSLDLFLFYVFWELMLIPMYFLINIWGHENRVAASYKFFLFTQAGGLLMLLSILSLASVHQAETGILTFDYALLKTTSLGPAASLLVMLGFFAAFAVKLPVVPFHTWLPDAHTEAPTAGSVILAGLLLKTGAYGLLRFVIPLFPAASAAFAPAAAALAALGILYGAVVAFGQRDLKRLVAYTSVSHMGFVLLGAFAGSAAAQSGAVMQMVAHGISTGALFIIVGLLQERLHTRDMERMGGFWSLAPRLSALGLVFCLASLGLPGFANFVAEFLVLAGSFPAHTAAVSVSAAGLVLAAVYSLRVVQRVFHGTAAVPMLPDLDARETLVLALLAVAILWLGLQPGLILHPLSPAMDGLSASGVLAGLIK